MIQRNDAASRGEAHRGRDAEVPADIPVRGWKDIAVRVKDEIGDDHTVLTAAGVAFFAFLAVIPALAALVSIAGLVTSPAEAAERIESLLGGLPQEAKDLLAGQLESMAGQELGSLSTGLIVAVALSLWSASGGMGHLIEGINIAYDERDERNFFHRKALSLVLTIGAILFLVAAVIGLAALPTLVDRAGLPSGARIAVEMMFWPILTIGFATGAAVLYRFGPDRSSPEWRWVSWGSVIAVLIWILATIGFRLYTATFGSYSETYGSLAAVVVLLLFLFITSFVILLGAQINSEMEHQTTVDTTEGPDQPMGRRDAVMADTVGATTVDADAP